MANRLQVYQALWAMDRLVSPEATTAAKFDQVRAVAGRLPYVSGF